MTTTTLVPNESMADLSTTTAISCINNQHNNEYKTNKICHFNAVL